MPSFAMVSLPMIDPSPILRALRTISKLFLVLALLGLGTSCSRARNSIYSFGEDLTDLIHLDVMLNAGTDLGMHVQATELLRVSAYSTEELHGFRLTTRAMGIFEESRDHFFLGPTYIGESAASNMRMLPGWSVVATTATMTVIHPQGFVAESFDEVGAGLQLGLFGLRIGVRPLEFLDLAGNFLLLDIMDDNLSWEERQMIWGIFDPALHRSPPRSGPFLPARMPGSGPPFGTAPEGPISSSGG